jgi:hypothetical protein
MQVPEMLAMTERVSVDGKVVEVGRTEGGRSQVKTAEGLEAIARRVGTRILHELVIGHACLGGLGCAMNRQHLLAVYDEAWVFCCEIQAEGSTWEGRAQ